MKTYNERMADVSARIRKGKHQRRAVSSVCLLMLICMMAAWWMVRPGNQPSEGASDYQLLAQKLRPFMYNDGNKNNGLGSSAVNGTMAGTVPNDQVSPGGTTGNVGTGSEYVEVTDNQVEGVTEADIFKRTQSHIFYLQENSLHIFSVAEEASKRIGTYEITMHFSQQLLDAWGDYRYGSAQEMFLSQDGRTLTIMYSAYFAQFRSCVILISLDVTDPTAIWENGRVFLQGGYLSSRMVEGKLLLASRYAIRIDRVNLDDPDTYVPQYGTFDDRNLVSPENITIPEQLNSCSYTVLTMVDPVSLEFTESVALLGFTEQMYVSAENIFISRNYQDYQQDVKSNEMTEIYCVGYGADGLELKGGICLEGRVKDQYSMDEKDGILRVVTSIRSARKNGAYWETYRSASLYCVSLEDMSIRASVEYFAPQGESAESVRFDGDMAYVCTAEIVTITDPVFFFDLSDLDNITWTDTGVIDGYSSSLIQMSDGYLLGIGYNASRLLKVEVYRQEGDRVVSVDAYEGDFTFSEVYKSYFVDRENGLIGLAVWDPFGGNMQYLLLHFDGYQLNVMKQIPLETAGGYLDTFRACIVDGYLYVMGTGYDVHKGPDPLQDKVLFTVEKVW